MEQNPAEKSLNAEGDAFTRICENESPRTVILDLTVNLDRLDSLLDRQDERLHLEMEQFVSFSSTKTKMKACRYLHRQADRMQMDVLAIVELLADL